MQSITSNEHSRSTDSAAVVAEIVAGQGINLAAAAALIPSHRNTKPVRPETIWRWAREGVSLPSGERVYLEVARVGSRWVTTKAALGRFLDAQAGLITRERERLAACAEGTSNAL